MDEEKEVGNDEEKKLSAKTISKIFKFVSAGGIVVCAVLKWVGFLPGSTIAEICSVWSCVYAVGAGTIDLNLMFDKFTGKEADGDR